MNGAAGAAEELQIPVHDLQEVADVSIPIRGNGHRADELLHRPLRTPADRLTGGPEADEDEVLEVEEWPLDELWRAFRDGRLRDGKAIVCLQGLRIARPDLFT